MTFTTHRLSSLAVVLAFLSVVLATLPRDVLHETKKGDHKQDLQLQGATLPRHKTAPISIEAATVDKAISRCSFVTKLINSSVTEMGLGKKASHELFLQMAADVTDFFTHSPKLFYHDVWYKGGPELAAASVKAHGYGTLSAFENDKTRTTLNGNMVLGSFSTFRNDAGQLVYGVLYGEQTLKGQYTWDLVRLVTSVLLQLDAIEPHGWKNGSFVMDSKIQTAVSHLVRSYVRALQDCAKHPKANRVSFTSNNTFGSLRSFLRAKETEKEGDFIEQYYRNGTFREDESELIPLPSNSSLYKKIVASWPAYHKGLAKQVPESWMTIKAIAKTRDHNGYLIAVEGNSTDWHDDILLIATGAVKPAWLDFAPKDIKKINKDVSAAHLVNAYKAFNPTTPAFLGELTVGPHSYVVMQDAEAVSHFPTDRISRRRYRSLVKLLEQFGTILAITHARGDNSFDKKSIPSSLEKGVVQAIGKRFKDFRDAVLRTAFWHGHQLQWDAQCLQDRAQHLFGQELQKFEEEEEDHDDKNDEHDDDNNGKGGDDDEDDDRHGAGDDHQSSEEEEDADHEKKSEPEERMEHGPGPADDREHQHDNAEDEEQGAHPGNAPHHPEEGPLGALGAAEFNEPAGAAAAAQQGNAFKLPSGPSYAHPKQLDFAEDEHVGGTPAPTKTPPAKASSTAQPQTVQPGPKA